MNRFVVFFLLANTWALARGGVYLPAAVGDTNRVLETGVHTPEGVFLLDPGGGARATMEGREVVVRFPVVRTTAPRTKGVLLVDSEMNFRLDYTPQGIVLVETETKAKSACVIQVILEPPLAEERMRVVVLGDVVFWNVRVNRSRESSENGWLSLPVEAREKAAQCVQDAARVFGAAERDVLDLRLKDEELARPAKVQGQLTERDIAEIRRIVYAMARQQILEDLARRPRDGWSERLRQWPGRHALDISATDNQRAAVYYAPNAGYELGKINGKWMIVGG